MCLSWERTCDKMWLILCVCFFEPSREAKYPKPLSKVPPNHNIDTIFVKGASHCETRPSLGPLGSLEYRLSASFSHHVATIFPSFYHHVPQHFQDNILVVQLATWKSRMAKVYFKLPVALPGTSALKVKSWSCLYGFDMIWLDLWEMSDPQGKRNLE